MTKAKFVIQCRIIQVPKTSLQLDLITMGRDYMNPLPPNAQDGRSEPASRGLHAGERHNVSRSTHARTRSQGGRVDCDS